MRRSQRQQGSDRSPHSFRPKKRTGFGPHLLPGLRPKPCAFDSAAECVEANASKGSDRSQHSFRPKKRTGFGPHLCPQIRGVPKDFGGYVRSSDMYIYGGGNTEGSSAVPVYDGEGPAKKGIVLVTVNYGLGVLGFFTHPELTKEAEYHASGNYGVLDLVAALHWVHDNIAAFGGDPAKVTIGGQSAGAGNSHTLTASPLAKGLFGAIAESGSSVSSGTSGSTLAAQEQVGVKFAHAKGAASLADLRKMSWQKLIELTPGPITGTGPYATAFRFSFHRQEIGRA